MAFDLDDDELRETRKLNRVGSIKVRELQKWNYKKHEYEKYIVPLLWNVKTYSKDFNEKINCASCGRKIEYGDSLTSLEIHTNIGFGYCVCEKCYEKEWTRREANNEF